MKNLNKYFAEFIGTFVLVFVGCGCAAIYGGANGSAVGVLSAAFAFGLSIVAVYYAIGKISGAHVNPAVSLAMFFDNRMDLKDMLLYMVSQVLGALAASATLFAILKCIPSATISSIGLGQNGYGSASAVSLTMAGAIITEIVLTCIFVLVVLGATSDEKYSGVGGLAIGGALTLVHLIGLPLTGTSVNPARSLAPAIMMLAAGKKTAINQVWVFIVAPLIGAILAVLIWKLLHLESKKPATEK